MHLVQDQADILPGPRCRRLAGMIAFLMYIFSGSCPAFSSSLAGLGHLLSIAAPFDAREYRIKSVAYEPIHWTLAFPENIVYNKMTGGLMPLERVGWHNGAEGQPMIGDFSLEFTVVIGSCRSHFGDGDFLLGYTLIDPDSANLVSHVWLKDDKATFLYFDQGCIITSSVGRCWDEDIMFNGDIGDTLVYRVTRLGESVRYNLKWRNEVFSGLIEDRFTGPIWPVAAFFRKGGTILSSTMLSGNVVVQRQTLSLLAKVLFLAGSVIVLGGIAYFRLLVKSRKKIRDQRVLIREQEVVLRSKEAVEQERARIATEMHDDLGSGLTTIQYLSDRAVRQVNDRRGTEEIQRIAELSNRLMHNMSEIIWAMNSRFDNIGNLTAYLRRYASEFLNEHDLAYSIKAHDDEFQDVVVGGEKRRNIYLVFKEVLHNAVKYSGAQKVQIIISAAENFEISVIEIGGKGFSPDESTDLGNGLHNCRQRMESMDGGIRFERTDDLMRMIIWVPIQRT